MGAGFASDAEICPPVPIGPAAAEMPPPTVTLPPLENALTASSELSTMTTSVKSSRQLPGAAKADMDSPAPICRPHPTPAVAIQLGALQLPSGRRAMTSPEPALPEKTNPALRMVNTARPAFSYNESSPGC